MINIVVSSRPDRAPQTSSTIVRRAHAVCGAKRRTPVVNRRRVALKQTRTTGCPLMLRACGMPPEHSVWAHIPHHAGQSLHAHKQNICAGEPTRLATHATCTLRKSTPAEQRRRTVHRSNASTSSSDASVSSIEIIRARATSRRPQDSAPHTSQSATRRSTRRRASAPTRHGAPSAKHTER